MSNQTPVMGGAQTPVSTDELLFDAAAIPAMLCAADGRILRANPALVALLGLEAWQQGLGLGDLIDAPQDAVALLSSDTPPDGIPIELQAPAGRAIPVVVHVRRVDEHDHERRLVQVEDRTAVAAREQALMQLVYKDDLTGLLNRRGFVEAAGRLHAQARRDDRYLSMLFIDVDGLKAINDELGHLAGDAAIIEAGHLLSEVFRTADVIGRYGGDEFCVLAMTNTPESTGLLESRLESALADHAASGDARFVLSVTIGAEHINEPSAMTVSEMIASADRVMYAKRRIRAT